jgi:hypothetical protein
MITNCNRAVKWEPPVQIQFYCVYDLTYLVLIWKLEAEDNRHIKSKIIWPKILDLGVILYSGLTYLLLIVFHFIFVKKQLLKSKIFIAH